MHGCPSGPRGYVKAVMCSHSRVRVPLRAFFFSCSQTRRYPSCWETASRMRIKNDCCCAVSPLQNSSVDSFVPQGINREKEGIVTIDRESGSSSVELFDDFVVNPVFSDA